MVINLKLFRADCFKNSIFGWLCFLDINTGFEIQLDINSILSYNLRQNLLGDHQALPNSGKLRIFRSLHWFFMALDKRKIAELPDLAWFDAIVIDDHQTGLNWQRSFSFFKEAFFWADQWINW